MRTVQGVAGMDASRGTATLSHAKKPLRHGKRSTARRNSMTIANGNRGGHMNELKPGDVNEDGKEIEQDGWITIWNTASEIEIPPTETSEDE